MNEPIRRLVNVSIPVGIMTILLVAFLLLLDNNMIGFTHAPYESPSRNEEARSGIVSEQCSHQQLAARRLIVPLQVKLEAAQAELNDYAAKKVSYGLGPPGVTTVDDARMRELSWKYLRINDEIERIRQEHVCS